MRSKLVQGTKSITCEKRVRPEYMTVPRLKSQNRVRNYRQNPKPCSSRHQKNIQETLILQRYFTKSPSLNRTALIRYLNASPSIRARTSATLSMLLILLSHKLRRGFRVKLRAQHGHRGRVRAIATINIRWTVAIELGTWRWGRIGGAAGSVTGGNGRFREVPGGTRS